MKAISYGYKISAHVCNDIGGLAGLIYGYDAIPVEWIQVLVRKEDITKLSNKLSKKYKVH